MDDENSRKQAVVRIPPSPLQPVLKQSCDTALQTAFHEQNWPILVNLAKQRYKSTKDPYYLAVEIAAKSQSDNGADQVTGRDAVLKLVADSNSSVKDVDALDLYEYAASSTKVNYAETVGVLRSRLVRAMPKDRSSSIRCLKACIYNSDWLHAQEITASMDKNFPEEKMYRIHNIFATYMYSQSPTCPAKSADLLAKLAKLKGDKEFESRGLLASPDTAPALSLSDQEAWLWLELQSTPQTKPEETIAALRKHALRLVDCGFSDVFILVLQELQELQAWDELWEICLVVIDKAIGISQKEAVVVDEKKSQLAQERSSVFKKKLAEMKASGGGIDSAQVLDEMGRKEDDATLRETLEDLREQRSEMDLVYLTLGTEPLVWKALINSISGKKNPDKPLKRTRKTLDKLMKALERSGEAKDLDHSRHDRAILRILFLRDAHSAPSEAISNTRIKHLLGYITKYYWDVSCFDNIKSFAETLTPKEATILFGELDNEARIARKAEDLHKALAVVSTQLKIRYLLASSSKNSTNCRCCEEELKDSVCISCFTKIIDLALDHYKVAIYDMDLRRNVLPTTNGDPLSELALLGSLSLLQLAKIRPSREYRARECSPLFSADMQYVFQAIVWLDSYLTAWPKNDPLRMLLIKLYLLIGCVSRAQSLWDKFDVKNAILDSLGALFYDRISTIAPGLFIRATSGWTNPMSKFSHYYNTAIRRTTPKQILDAFQNQNWQSIPAMATFSDDLARSCSLVMAVVEERRGLRLRSGIKGLGTVEEDPLVCDLNLNHTLKDTTEYSYLPDFGGKDSVPTRVLVSHGPSLSNRRAHLSLLAERFIDLVSYVQPRDLKPSRPGPVLQVDQKYSADTSVNIGRQMEELMTELDGLTVPEIYYYRLILNLAKLVSNFLTLYTVPQPAPDSRAVMDSTIKETLEHFKEQSDGFWDVPENYPAKLRAFYGFVALHAMGMLRESALVMKLTASYLTAALEKAKAADKAARSNNEVTWASGQLKNLATEATAAEKQIERRIKALKELVEGGGWIDRLHAWTFFDSTKYTTLESTEKLKKEKNFREKTASKLKEAIGGEAAFEDWAGRVVESWQDLITGWSAVKFG